MTLNMRSLSQVIQASKTYSPEKLESAKHVFDFMSELKSEKTELVDLHERYAAVLNVTV